MRSLLKSIFAPAKLADELMIERATVGRYLDQLETKKYIERPHNRFDRRVVNINLTPKGEKVAQLSIDLMGKAYKSMITGLTAAENKHFVTLIKKLTESIPAARE